MILFRYIHIYICIHIGTKILSLKDSMNAIKQFILSIRSQVFGAFVSACIALSSRKANYLQCHPTNNKDKLLIYAEETTGVHLFETLAACGVTESTLALSKCEQWLNPAHSD